MIKGLEFSDTSVTMQLGFREIRVRYLNRSLMEETTIAELQSKLSAAVDALRRSEERATAGQLALEMMHEITAPLQALRDLTYFASVDINDFEKVRDCIRLAEDQMVRISHIAGQTLRLTSPDPSARPIDLVALAEAALRIHQQEIESKRVKLVKDLPAQIVAEVHTGKMLHVISNLIVKALDDLPPDGTLRLRIRKMQGEIRVVIADNGRGISPEHSGAIFQPFFTMKEERGTGLGLALAKEIIEHHRGTIRIRSSVRPGKSGTIFRLSLPIGASVADDQSPG